MGFLNSNVTLSFIMFGPLAADDFHCVLRVADGISSVAFGIGHLDLNSNL